ncbi:hypothetical protein ING2E5B_1087 [Fermentimonas caenicola]|uniref:Secreted protein n=1 Tax=Fermentimonas caenicola TaxID=1562970 RepID=A0A098BYT1_9BACT|nr:hypothetical protein ING2E5B_1087 [Fermentimonas caenicola]
MSKIIKAISLICLIIIAGCSQDVIIIPDQQIQEGEEVAVSFNTIIPEFKTVVTRANGGVNDMYVLVFDENGNYIARRQATLSNQTETGGTFIVQLPSSSNSRIVHFISNYDWSGFNDIAGLNEATVVALLSTSNTTFWSRVELENGISSTSFSGLTVSLLRNQAKISVVNEADELTFNGFTIHNKPSKGSVAQYSSTTGFEEGVITEPLDMTLIPAQSSDISTDEKYLFERKNAYATDITTVIVRGNYNGQQYYYKIDLIDLEKNRYDIERNYHYIVKIKTVTRAGYTSFNDALEGASHNNTALDPIIEKYPIISDGISKLEVEKTLVILTKPNQQFSVWAKYFPEISNTSFNNSGVSVTLQSGNTSIVEGSLNFNPTTGNITATGLSQIPEEPGNARIVVSKGDLARTIRVVLRTPFSFSPVTINDQNPGLVADGQSSQATLKFNIPDDFPDDLFPLPIRIYTNGLYPASTGLEMVVEGSQIHYIYRATQRGIQTINFKTNKSGNAETVAIKADYFADGSIAYNSFVAFRGNISYGNNVNVPNNVTVSASIGSLTIPSTGTYSYAPPSNYNLNTSVNLEYENQVAWNTNSNIRQSFHEYYRTTTTIGHMYNNGNLNLALDGIIVTGRIRYTTNTNNYNGMSNVPGNATLTVTGTAGATGEMMANQRYQLTIPGTASNNSTIRVTYRTSNTNYYVDTTVGALRSNQYMQLRSNGGRVQNY